MYPPIFQICAAVPAVTALLGTGPTRLFPFGEAPQDTALPYAVWQTVSGLPENYVDCPPDIDRFTIQVDVYAGTGSSARDVAKALRDAIEPHANIVAWRGESRDPDTNHRRYSFDVDWHVHR